MTANSLIPLIFTCLALYLAYRAFFGSKERSSKLNSGSEVSRKHWPKGSRINVLDDGTYSVNISRVAGNTFGDYASRDCTALLIPDFYGPEGRKSVAVIIDGLKVGNLSDRDVEPLFAILDHLNMGLAVTSCDAYIRGGGTGLDGLKTPYQITLDISWFET